METEVYFILPSGSAAEDFALELVQKGYAFEETAMAPDPDSPGVILGIRNLITPDGSPLMEDGEEEGEYEIEYTEDEDEEYNED